MKANLLLVLFLFTATFLFAQRAKNGNYTVTSPNTVVNAYTTLTSNASAGNTSIAVTSNTLTNSVTTSALAAGDLILIVQMQGVEMDISVVPTTSWGGTYTVSNGAMGDFGNVNNYKDEWGQVTNYFNSGKYEYAQVMSVTGGTGINLMCGLKNSYDVLGHVQIVRVPRFDNLTLDPNASIIPTTWNGNSGGIVALEVNGSIIFGNNSSISASAFGFRGGVVENTSAGPAPNASDVGKPGYSVASEGAEKGEGIGGYATAEYTTQWYSRYGCGAPANGGGGGNYRNSGGGGGSNIGSGTYTGYGVPNTSYASNWNLELAGMSAAPSSGGGRGGYSLAQSDQNENTLGPNQTAWAGDYRRNEGGLGGHPLAYDATRIFMGGGGGAGEQDSGQGGSGGKGGGIVFILSYGTMSGNGTIEAKGENGQKSNPASQTAGPGVKKGNDGAGGGGAGGSIFINNSNPIPATITLNVNGGNGGNNDILFGTFTSTPESNGPGGGGSGGFVNISSGTPVINKNGGSNGVVVATGFTSIVANFPPNGATSGAVGTNMTTAPYFDLTPINASICSGQTANIGVTIVGTQPAGSTITWYSTQFGSTVVHTGATWTTPALSATTTYYVGVCPSTFRIPVTVTVGGPTISGIASITNATCTTAGAINGLSASGGVAPLTYAWNGVSTANANLSNASAGSYTLVVTDGAGCTASSGPYSITTTGGPVVNTTNMVVTNSNCLNTNGSISGITATGTGLTYSWNSGAYSTLNISNLPSGSYSLVVTDNNGCTANAGPISITQATGPVINSAAVVVTQTSCGLNNGAISGLSVSGGTAPYSYSWNSGAFSTLNISSLASGSYTLVVTDNVGCTANYGPVTISTSSAPTLNTASISITHDHCGQSIGAISGISVSGGVSPYSYSWNGGIYNTLNITNVQGNNYSLVVTDNLGCTASAGPFTVNNIAGPTVNTTNVVITNATCAGNNGSITGITAAGTGLTYSWNLTPSASLNISNLAAGTYGLLVTDNFGCQATAGPYSITQTSGPTVNTTNMVLTHTSCGLSNGAINGITATGTGLTYQWNGVSGTLNQSNLTAGNYTLVVTDGNGCNTTVGPFTVNSSTAVVLNTANVVLTDDHCGQAIGAISGVTVSGGVAPYIYSWNSGAFNTLNLSNIPSGSYTLLVTDNAGCTATAGPYTINNIAGPAVNVTNVAVTNESCAFNDGSILGITASGSGLIFSWNGTAGTLNQTGLAPGNYSLVITDGFGCSVNGGSYVINPASPLVLDDNNVVIVPTGCIGNTGSISGITFTGGITPIISWTSGQSTLNISNLGAGSYTLTITDAQNCSVSGTYVVPSTSGLTINTATVVVSNDLCGNGSGSITGISVSGGSSPYGYSWNSDASLTTLDINGLDSGTYNLIVTDASGCTATTSLFVGFIAGPTIDISNALVVPENCLGNNGSISNVSVNGNGPFTYAWQGSALTSLNISGLTSGNYNLVVTDANGCSLTSSPINVTSVPAPNADFNLSSSVVSPGENVHFTDASTGTIQTYNWLVGGLSVGSANSADYVSNIEGNYMMTLVVTSPEGCMDSISKLVSVVGNLIIPNIITANNDNENDLFIIKNLKPFTKLLISNRWGNIVYSADNYLNDWNGKSNEGFMLDDGVYFYQLITADGKTMQGFVHLLIK